VCQFLILIKHGRVQASGATETVLTPTNIRTLYGVDADVQLHPAAGHLVVVPVARSSPGSGP
jgi:iron complex transport system ATP-binding protein